MKHLKTNSDLPPRIRFLEILNYNLISENFRLIKSSNAFKRELSFGEQVIRLSFISSMGAIHDIQTVHTIKFMEFENIFRKVFKKYSWKEWTCIYHVYSDEIWLCTEDTFAYSDESLNQAAMKFFDSIKPQIDSKINSNYLEELYLELINFSNPYLSYLRIERRVLLSIWLAKKRCDPKIGEIKNNSLKLFEKSNEAYKPNLEEVLKVIKLIELNK